MTPSAFIWTLIGIIVANILFWVFLWGKRVGRVNQRLNNLENPQILPECQVIFNEIKEKLGECVGRLDIISNVLKINAKEEERRKD